MDNSIEEKVKQRILECQKLGVHNLVLRLFSGFSIKAIEKFGVSEFEIDKIVVKNKIGNDSVEILKRNGVLYNFLHETTDTEKRSRFRGVDETRTYENTISLSVNSSVIFRSKWRNICHFGSMDISSKDYPEEILSYIPGDWYNDLLAISMKKDSFQKEENKIAVEKAKIEKMENDKSNFGL